MDNIKVIAFDADDTLWINEPYFQETEKLFCSLLEDFLPQHSLAKELFKTEVDNLALYGYGVKGFMLSMVETAIRVSNNTLRIEIVNSILDLGKELLARPIELLDGVEDVLKRLSANYKLVVATKGDLLDQERKLKKSGIDHYFHHVEIMSDKQEKDYLKLVQHLDIPSSEFAMVGNSVKSDIFPVLKIGGNAIHIPYHTTWAHEHVEYTIDDPRFVHFVSIRDLLNHFPT